MNGPRVAIVGAGVAGLGCGQALRARGASVTLFDKGRAPGGRITTRRVNLPGGLAQFDHGAQFLTLRDQAFAAALEEALGSKSIAAWPDASDGEHLRWVGAPGMSAVSKALGKSLDIYAEHKIDAVIAQDRHWRLRRDDGAEIGDFDNIVIAVPAEQAASLLAPISEAFAVEARQAVTAPCWGGLFAFARSAAPAAMTLIQPDHPILDWISRDSSKPARPQDYSCWEVHARSDWSREQIERAPEDVASMLNEALREVLATTEAPLFRQAHRWRYARVERAACTPFAFDPIKRIGVCGDWRLGPRLELAWKSGHELAKAMLA